MADISPKDINLIKGALRRAFARSDLHRQVENLNRIEHSDPSHPRCKKWSWCNNCGQVIPTWRTQIDHVSPVVPLDKTAADMSIAELASRIWCDPGNLSVLCLHCHDIKSTIERGQRPKRKKRK